MEPILPTSRQSNNEYHKMICPTRCKRGPRMRKYSRKVARRFDFRGTTRISCRPMLGNCVPDIWAVLQLDWSNSSHCVHAAAKAVINQLWVYMDILLQNWRNPAQLGGDRYEFVLGAVRNCGAEHMIRTNYNKYNNELRNFAQKQFESVKSQE